MNSKKNMTKNTTAMNLPPIHERYHDKAGKYYYVTREKENPHLFHYYYFEQEPTTFKVDERGYLIESLIYGSQIPVIEMIYEVTMYNYQYKETIEHMEPFQLYHEFMDTLLYHNFTFTINGTVYEKNIQPDDDENVPDLVSLLPNMSAIPDWNKSGYTYYCINRDLYNWEYCYYLYLFDSKPTIFRPNELFPDHYTVLNKYGNKICYRKYQFYFDSQFSQEGKWEERHTMSDKGIIYSGTDFISSLIYHNFEITVDDQRYEAYPLPNDPVIRDLIPELPSLPEQEHSDVRSFYYRHYYITQDKYNLTKYYLYLLKYEPASFEFDMEGNLVALTKYGEPIRTDPYEYTLGHGQKDWYFLRNKDPRREFLYHNYDEIRDAIVYNNVAIEVSDRIYPKNLYPNYVERPTIVPDFPKIPFIDDFKFKHYYLVQNKKRLETFNLYLLEYEPVAMEVAENEKVVFFQQYRGQIGSIVCTYTFGDQKWSYNNNGYYNYSGLYHDMEDALMYHNFAMDLNGEYHHKYELPDDGIVPSRPFEFPPIPNVPGAEDKYRYYWITQNQGRLDHYSLYLFRDQPTDYLINRYGDAVFINQEGYTIKFKHGSHTVGTNNWNMSLAESDSLRASELNHFIDFCNFDLNVEFNSSSGLADNVIEAPANSYPNDGFGIGTVRNGWTTINGQCYYYVNGDRKRGDNGWLDLDGQAYYLLGANNWSRVENASVTTVRPSKARSGNVIEVAGVYYFERGGRMVTGVQEINGDIYRFSSDGKFEEIISGTSVYRAKVEGDIKYKPGPNESTRYRYAKGERVKTVIPKSIERIDEVNWIQVSYTGGTTTRYVKYGWVLETELEEWTGNSYIFSMPGWKPKIASFKEEIAEFFGYQRPDEQVKLMQLDENLETNVNYSDAFDTFVAIWNRLDDSKGIDTVLFVVHGDSAGLATEHTWELNSEGKKRQITFLGQSSFEVINEHSSIPVMDDKNISSLLLVSCGTSEKGWNVTGNDKDSIARLFGQKYGIGKVVAGNTVVELDSSEHNTTDFQISPFGRFVLYYKGVKGVETKYCRQPKYTMSEILDEIFIQT